MCRHIPLAEYSTYRYCALIHQKWKNMINYPECPLLISWAFFTILRIRMVLVNYSYYYSLVGLNFIDLNKPLFQTLGTSCGVSEGAPI